LNKNNFKENYFELIFIYSFIYINAPLVEMQPGEMQLWEMQLSLDILLNCSLSDVHGLDYSSLTSKGN